MSQLCLSVASRPAIQSLSLSLSILSLSPYSSVSSNLPGELSLLPLIVSFAGAPRGPPVLSP